MTTDESIRKKAEDAVKNLLVVACMENCQRSTVGQIMLALDRAGLKIVEKADAWGARDPVLFVRELMERRGVSPYALAIAANISPSTLTRALNDENHKFTLSTTTLQKISDWDRAQG